MGARGMIHRHVGTIVGEAWEGRLMECQTCRRWESKRGEKSIHQKWRMINPSQYAEALDFGAGGGVGGGSARSPKVPTMGSEVGERAIPSRREANPPKKKCPRSKLREGRGASELPH